MKILIIADFEGISGVGSIADLEPTSETYAHTCHCVAEDINAAVCGAFTGGATQVTVCEWHSGGRDVTADMLAQRVRFIPGKMSATARTVFHEAYDGLFFIGAHAMAGTLDAFVDHTRNVREWHDFTIGGQRHGEIGILAILAGVRGTPLLLVTGDDAACREGQAYGDSVVTIAIKRGLRWDIAELVPEDSARATIRAGAAQAMSLIGQAWPYTVTYPAEVTVTLNRADYCEKLLARNSKLERIDARMVRTTAIEAWDVLV